MAKLSAGATRAKLIREGMSYARAQGKVQSGYRAEDTRGISGQLGGTTKLISIKETQEKPAVQVVEQKPFDYKEGSTMYELGFRYKDEYRKAQARGATYGVHDGKLVPMKSAIVERGGKQYRYTIDQLAEQNKTKVKKTAKELQTEADLEFREKTKGMTKIDKDNWIKDTDLAKIQVETPELYSVLMSKGYDAYVSEVNTLNKKKRGAYQSEVQKNINEFEAELAKQPEKFQLAYKHGGINTYLQVVDAHNEVVKSEIRAFEKELRDKPWQLQVAYNTGGFGGYNEAVESYNKSIANREADYKEAINKLEKYKVGKQSYDIDKFVKDNKKAGASNFEIRKTLTRANFDSEAIDSAIKTSELSWAKRTWRGMTPWEEAKGEKADVKGVAEMTAVTLVPGVWLKDVEKMEPWQIGVNAGLDLLILVPVAGWGARAGAKALVKAGTATLSKSLAKTLPRALVKAGEKQLAKESITVATKITRLGRLMEAVEKTAKATAKAERSGNIDKFIKAVQAESNAKLKFGNAFRRVGADIGQLNAKLEDTAVQSLAREHLKRAVGMSSKADSFADYIANTSKEIARQNLSKTLPQKTGTFFKNQLKGYVEAVDDIKNVAGALPRGSKRGAKHLLATKDIKIKDASTKVLTTKEELYKRLDDIEKQLAQQSSKARARASKYKKDTLLNKWDSYIEDSWHPHSGSPRTGRPAPDLGDFSPNIERELRMSGSTKTATATRTGRAGSSTRDIVKPSVATHIYSIPISTILGSRLVSVFINPQDGSAVVIPENVPANTKEIVTNPEHIIQASEMTEVQPATSAEVSTATKIKTTTRPATYPATKTTVSVTPKPTTTTKAKTEPIVEVTPMTETQPAQLTEVKPKTLTEVKTPEKLKPIEPKIPIPPPVDLDGVESLYKKGKIKGYITFNMGWQRYGIIPPYTQAGLINLGQIDKDERKAKLTPQQSLVIVGSIPTNRVAFDLGTVDGWIDVANKTINFTGGGTKTDVGTRKPSNTKGISLSPVSIPARVSSSKNGSNKKSKNKKSSLLTGIVNDGSGNSLFSGITSS